MAKKYADGGYLYEVKPLLKRGLDENELTISEEEFKKLLRGFEEAEIDFLSNYGEVEYEGFEKVLSRAVVSEYEGAANDVELIGSIINATDEIEKIHRVLWELFEFTHIESNSEFAQYHEGKIYVMLLNDFIEIIKVSEEICQS